MIDQYFTEAQLLRHVRKSDFWKLGNFQPPQNNIKKIAEKAHQEFQKGNVPKFFFFQQNDKDIASTHSITDSLILRKLAYDISRCYGVKQSSRNIIIEQVISLLRESIPVSILRVDIKNFYESIPVDNIINKLERDGRIVKKTVSILSNIYKQRCCIFRGLPTSSVLAEIYMKDFDKKIKSDSSVYYYARFVDDIILFSLEENDGYLLDLVKSNLPQGLTVNTSKTYVAVLDNENTCKTLDYLGYKFDIKCSTKCAVKREVTISISNKKINKIKTRIVLSLKDFAQNNDKNLLLKRLKFLSGNCKISSRKFNSYLMTGIKYNYPLITSPNKSLLELDVFFRNCIYPKKNNFNINQTDPIFWGKLKKISFIAGYRDCFFHSFDRFSLYDIKKCWKYV